MDRLLSTHELNCTVCENNTGDCTLHNTFADIRRPHIIEGLKGFADGLEKPVSNPISDFAGKFGRST